MEKEWKDLRGLLCNYKDASETIEDARRSALPQGHHRVNGRYATHAEEKCKMMLNLGEYKFLIEFVACIKTRLDDVRKYCGEEGYQLIKMHYVDEMSIEEISAKMHYANRTISTKINFYMDHYINRKVVKEGETPWNGKNKQEFVQTRLDI